MKKKYWDRYCDLTDHAAVGGEVFLCRAYRGYELIELLTPRSEDDFDDCPSTIYWGRESYENEKGGAFNGLRQNIALLMAAMNNEL